MEKGVKQRADAGPARGIILPERLARLEHERILPPEDLRPWIRHYWWVSWDLPEPQIQENLPHPSIHLVFQNGRAEIVGVPTGRFRAHLTGAGWVFGAKFEPGAFASFAHTPAARLRNRRMNANVLLGADAEETARRIFHESGRTAMEKRSVILSEFLRKTARPLSAEQLLAGQLVRRLEEDRRILRVEDLCEMEGISLRKLQRLFQKYVGVPPRWVISRYRMHEALARLDAEKDRAVNWSEFALELGYYDQAHFINDFVSASGYTPEEYEQRRRSAARFDSQSSLERNPASRTT